MDQPLSGKCVDVSPLLLAAGYDVGPVEIIETAGMYPYKDRSENNWAYFTAVGCKALKAAFDTEGRHVTRIGIVGICSGVEGIAVAHAFQPDLKSLIVTDIDAEILRGTCVNLRAATERFGISVLPLVGSFCEPLAESSETVDFVHANIPNLPADPAMDLSRGAEKGTFLPPGLYERYQPPAKYLQWALGPQFAYLRSAREVIPPGGSVITELGGRVPVELVRELFAELGLTYSEVITGFKEQTEALIDFQGYSEFERRFGVEFDFYHFAESLGALAEAGLSRPSAAVSASQVKTLLSPFRVTATESLELHRRGVAVGHTVHIFRGVR